MSDPITFAIYVIIFFAVCAIVWWAINSMGLPRPFQIIAICIFAVIGLLFIARYLPAI